MAHNEIKTYRFSDSTTDNQNFILKKAEDVYYGEQDESDSPHRHDYYAIILIEKGKGVHYVDFHEYPLEDYTVYFILPGQMHQLIPSEKPQGWVLAFTEEFLITNTIPQKLIQDIYLFNDYGESPPLHLNESQLSTLKNIIAQIEYFSAIIKNYTAEAVGSLLKLFLIQSNNHCSLAKENLQLVESGNLILRKFKQSLEENYKTEHKVSGYADELAVTADYLNKTVKNITGKSAKEHIQSKIITEAKRSLIFSELSGKELSFELGFDESAHFNNFFKKATGQTPLEFRSSYKTS